MASRTGSFGQDVLEFCERMATNMKEFERGAEVLILEEQRCRPGGNPQWGGVRAHCAMLAFSAEECARHMKILMKHWHGFGTLKDLVSLEMLELVKDLRTKDASAHTLWGVANGVVKKREQ